MFDPFSHLRKPDLQSVLKEEKRKPTLINLMAADSHLHSTPSKTFTDPAVLACTMFLDRQHLERRISTKDLCNYLNLPSSEYLIREILQPNRQHLLHTDTIVIKESDTKEVWLLTPLQCSLTMCFIMASGTKLHMDKIRDLMMAIQQVSRERRKTSSVDYDNVQRTPDHSHFAMNREGNVTPSTSHKVVYRREVEELGKGLTRVDGDLYARDTDSDDKLTEPEMNYSSAPLPYKYNP